jgi:hypothetical protein
MSMPLPPDLEEPTEDQLALVDAVTVSTFSATPERIVPFGASRIAWSVENVPPHVRIRIGATAVPTTGWFVSTPLTTARYELLATYGPAKRTLGIAHVTVDASACVAVEISNAFRILRAMLEKAIRDGEDTYWSSDPRHPDRFLWIRPAGSAIEFYMKFRLKNPGWTNPDPWVTLRGSFQFTVIDGALAPTHVEADGTVDAGWGIKLVAGLIVAIGVAVNDANEQATETARAIPTLLAEQLSSFNSADRGTRWHRVTHGERNGHPFLEMTQCPWPVRQPHPTPDPRRVGSSGNLAGETES